MQERTALLVDYYNFDAEIVATFEGLKTVNGPAIQLFLAAVGCKDTDDSRGISEYNEKTTVYFRDELLSADDQTHKAPFLNELRYVFRQSCAKN